MPVPAEEFKAAAQAATETARSRPKQGAAEAKSRPLSPARNDRKRDAGRVDAEDSFQLAGAAGLATGSAIALAFWTVVLVIFHVWVP